jgi:hypothetical protein
MLITFPLAIFAHMLYLYRNFGHSILSLDLRAFTHTLHGMDLVSSPIMLLPICLSVVGTRHHLLVAGDPPNSLKLSSAGSVSG